MIAQLLLTAFSGVGSGLRLVGASDGADHRPARGRRCARRPLLRLGAGACHRACGLRGNRPRLRPIVYTWVVIQPAHHAQLAYQSCGSS